MGLALWLAEGKALQKRAEDAEGRERRERIARECDNKHLREQFQDEIERLQNQIRYLENLNERLLQQIGIDPLEPTSVENEDSTPVPMQTENEPASPTAKIIVRDRKRKTELRASLQAEEARWLDERRARAEQVARDLAQKTQPVM